MQRIQLLSNVLMLAITAFVTIGSLYISLEAASQQGVDLDAPDSTMPSDLVTGITAQSNGGAALGDNLLRADRSHDVILDGTASFSGHLVPANESLGTTVGQFTVGIV